LHIKKTIFILLKKYIYYQFDTWGDALIAS